MIGPARWHQSIKYLAFFLFVILLTLITTQYNGYTYQKNWLSLQITGGNFSVLQFLDRYVMKEPQRRLIIGPPKMPLADDINSFRAEIKRRRELMLCQCKNMTRSTSTGWYHLHVLDKENIVYFPLIKASTSTWKRNLLRLSYMPQDKVEEWLTRQPGGNQGWKGLLQNYCKSVQTKAAYDKFLHSKKGTPVKSFIIVRHPFTRLVSAYRYNSNNQERAMLINNPVGPNFYTYII